MHYDCSLRAFVVKEIFMEKMAAEKWTAYQSGFLIVSNRNKISLFFF